MKIKITYLNRELKSEQNISFHEDLNRFRSKVEKKEEENLS